MISIEALLSYQCHTLETAIVSIWIKATVYSLFWTYLPVIYPLQFFSEMYCVFKAYPHPTGIYPNRLPNVPLHPPIYKPKIHIHIKHVTHKYQRGLAITYFIFLQFAIKFIKPHLLQALSHNYWSIHHTTVWYMVYRNFKQKRSSMTSFRKTTHFMSQERPECPLFNDTHAVHAISVRRKHSKGSVIYHFHTFYHCLLAPTNKRMRQHISIKLLLVSVSNLVKYTWWATIPCYLLNWGIRHMIRVSFERRHSDLFVDMQCLIIQFVLFL